MGQPGDAFLEQEEVPFAIVGGDTITYIVQDAKTDAVETAWRRASSAVGHIGLVTTYPLPAHNDPTYDVVAAVAATTMIVFGAYDGEGALVLTRR